MASDTMATMKSEYLHLRASKPVKEAIVKAAARDGRSYSQWLIWLAAQADEEVRKAVLNEPTDAQ